MKKQTNIEQREFDLCFLRELDTVASQTRGAQKSHVSSQIQFYVPSQSGKLGFVGNRYRCSLMIMFFGWISLVRSVSSHDK